MKRFTFVLLLVVILLSLALSACGSSSSSSTTAASEGEKLMNDRCSVCHAVNVIKAQSLSKEEWQTVVKSMINRGAKLTSDEETKLVEFLAKTYGK